MRYEHDPHYPLPLHDPAAVDFRAFYPYTPNEVKHRRRTTSAQLKVLEAIFRVDTKPNATLRNELAAQLGMTARGVQVWFQNRRAKEKNRTNKKQGASSTTAPATSETDPVAETNLKDEDDTDPASPAPTTPGDELLEDLLKAETAPENQHATDSQTSSPSPALASPPKLHVVTDPAIRPTSAASWKPSPSDETPPESAVFPSRHPLLAAELRSQRRGSLPANAFFHPFATSSTHFPRSIDAWDPLARRRSVDTSLQRLVTHPYAQHARARNGALFGPRSPSQPQSGRQSSLSGKKPLPLQARRPLLPHRPPNHYLDMRRASMDPRTLMSSATDGLSPSSSPHPLFAVRASLPDTSLFTTTRRYVPQISGPLPEPGFTFGNASTSSPTEDEPPSPDLSSYSFPPRDDATEDDDVMSSVSFETLSRFGSAVSIATSESSVFSTPAFYDISELAPNQDRRGSCGSAHQAHLPCVTASLDRAMQSQQSPAPVTTDGYFDETSTPTVLAAGVNQPQVDDVSSASSFTSPGSTASPDCTLSSIPPTNGPVSNTDELVSAFPPGSRKPTLTNDGSSSLGQLDLQAEQRQQHGAGLTHQVQAVVDSDGPPFSFNGSSEARIDIANTSPENNPPLSITLLSRQDITGFDAMKKQLQFAPLNDEVAHGDFTGRFPDLMDGMGFGAALAMFDNESSASVIGQAVQRSGTATECDPLASLGLGMGVDAFATSGVVAPESYGAASSIAPNHPTFAS